MRKNIITILIVIFVAYAFIKHQKQLVLNTKIDDNPTYQFVKKAQSYLEVLSTDPPTNKNRPILQKNIPTEEVKYTDKATAVSLPIPPNHSNKENKKISDVNNKMNNIIYNVIHTPEGQQLLEKILNNQPNSIKQSQEINPYHNNSSIELLQGEGNSAECGDTIKAHYIIRLVNGQEIENTYKSGELATFRIGEQQVIKGLEYAAMGMKKGGRKRLVVPPKSAYNKQKFSKGLVAGNEFVTIDVGIFDVNPLFKGWQNKIRIFEAADTSRNRPILCGNTVSFNYTLSTANEEVLYRSTDPVGFILGSSSVPPAINKAFFDIRTGGKRSVIFPSSLIYNKKISFLPKDIKIPAKGMLILDINMSN